MGHGDRAAPTTGLNGRHHGRGTCVVLCCCSGEPPWTYLLCFFSSPNFVKVMDLLPLWRGPLRTSARWRRAASPSSQRNFCVACVEQAAKEVVVLYMAPAAAADQVAWARVVQFHADKMGYHDRMTLLRSQGAAEVVLWDLFKQLVLAVDVDSRVTRSIGPLSGRTHYSDFIPYVNSYVEIYRWRSGQAWRRTRPRSSRLLRRRRTCGR